MFKKTLIAMSLAAVTGSAMADVSVSGRVEQTFVDDEAVATGWTADTFNMINFKASEDLGNGISAFAKFSLLDKDGSNGTTDGADQTVGLSGGFGTVVFGTMEDFTESKVMSLMSMYGPAGIELAGVNAERNASAMAYVSPTMNGLHAGIAGYTELGTADNGDTGSNFDAIDMMIAYDNGPLSVKLARETLKSEMLTGAEDQEVTTLGVKYSMGDLSVAGVWVDSENEAGVAASDNNDYMLRADYTVGANKVTIGHANSEDATGAATTDTTSVELIHNFSKRTAAYIGHKDIDTANSNKTYVGIQHTF
jgi:predicted porin